jgi:hypothetical protein
VVDDADVPIARGNGEGAEAMALVQRSGEGAKSLLGAGVGQDSMPIG